jgi:hypothetical protein
MGTSVKTIRTKSTWLWQWSNTLRITRFWGLVITSGNASLSFLGLSSVLQNSYCQSVAENSPSVEPNHWTDNSSISPNTVGAYPPLHLKTAADTVSVMSYSLWNRDDVHIQEHQKYYNENPGSRKQWIPNKDTRNISHHNFQVRHPCCVV